MSDESLIPSAPEPTTARTPRARDLVCGFCESRLTPSGEVIKLSDHAKALRDFEDDLDDERATHRETKRLLDEANSTIETLNAHIKKTTEELQKAKAKW